MQQQQKGIKNGSQMETDKETMISIKHLHSPSICSHCQMVCKRALKLMLPINCVRIVYYVSSLINLCVMCVYYVRVWIGLGGWTVPYRNVHVLYYMIAISMLWWWTAAASAKACTAGVKPFRLLMRPLLLVLCTWFFFCSKLLATLMRLQPSRWLFYYCGWCWRCCITDDLAGVL